MPSQPEQGGGRPALRDSSLRLPQGRACRVWPKGRPVQPDEIPAVLLARLAVDRKHQGRGLGQALVKHFVEKALAAPEIVGVRPLLVHALDAEAVGFYQHFGFTSSPIDERTLMVPISDLR